MSIISLRWRLYIVQARTQKETFRRFMLGKSFGNHYLTPRETDVLKYVVMGYTAKKIGQLLKISFRTVETYIESLKIKLGCTSKGDIPAVMIKSGLIHEIGLF